MKRSAALVKMPVIKAFKRITVGSSRIMIACGRRVFFNVVMANKNSTFPSDTFMNELTRVVSYENYWLVSRPDTNGDGKNSSGSYVS